MFINMHEILTDEVLCGEELQIWAHTGEGRKAETLQEHTERTQKYFVKLLEDRKLKMVLDNFTDAFFKDASVKTREMFKRSIINISTFHDFGKINPAYQKNVLKNKKFCYDRIDVLDGNKHSFLSAMIYFDYFMKQVLLLKEEIETDEWKCLQYFVFLNSYIVSRHHGDLSAIGEFAKRFESGCEAYTILQAFNDKQFAKLYKGPFFGMKVFSKIIESGKKALYGDKEDKNYREKSIYVYTYIRFLYSLLVSSDYYATTEYTNGVEIKDYGDFDEGEKINKIYEQSEIMKKIISFNPNMEDNGKDINILRNKMFLEVEKNLLKNKSDSIFFVEAPTGSGKSNMAVNVSLKLLNDYVRKIIYVYPFNTLIEQNLKSLKKIFGTSEIMDEIAVVNSITPIKMNAKQRKALNLTENDEEDEENFYQKILLDRQFMNYPLVLTTHVNLFDIMFSHKKEAAVSFYQLSGSVIVLDEIQSYKNDIWTEIMYFLQCISQIMNMKIVIMSATLPALNYLTDKNDNVTYLVNDGKKYFEDKRFKNRVSLSFELLQNKISMEKLKEHVISNAKEDTNILIEFINKKSAYDFYDMLLENQDLNSKVHCMTGDYNQADREQVLKQITSSKGNILVATQVVEAGVDIDMDIGYKDISRLDSEEQFLGRINRNYKSDMGVAYLFDLDNAKKIYGSNDFRIEPEFTVSNMEMREILKNKDFDKYYRLILDSLKERLNNRKDESGIEEFFNIVEKLKFQSIEERMKLIQEDTWHISVFVSREIKLKDGIVLNGKDIWDKYKEILSDNEMKYAEKQVRLSEIKSQLSYFIYKVKKNADICYNDIIGELYFLEDGERYMKDGHLDIKRISDEYNVFVD